MHRTLKRNGKSGKFLSFRNQDKGLLSYMTDGPFLCVPIQSSAYLLHSLFVSSAIMQFLSVLPQSYSITLFRVSRTTSFRVFSIMPKLKNNNPCILNRDKTLTKSTFFFRFMLQEYFLMLYQIAASNNYKIIEMNPEVELGEFNKIIDCLSSNERYVYVYFKEGGATALDVGTLKPHLLVYENNDEKTVAELMEYFVTQINMPDIKPQLQWELYGGYKLSRKSKIIDIKKELRRDNIDGLLIIAKVQDLSWTDQCAVKTYATAEKSFYKDAKEIPFHIPEVSYIIYLPITSKTQYEQAKTQLTTQIKRVFGVNVQKSDFDILFITTKENREARTQDLKGASGTNIKEKFIINFKKKPQLKAPPRQNNTFIVIKGENLKPTMFHYDDLKDKKVIDVLNDLEKKQNWHEYGLMISQYVVKPFDTFKKVDDLCKNSTKITKHLAAYVIRQCHMFQQQIKPLFSTKELVDFEKIVVTTKVNEQRRKKCQDFIRDRAQKANHEWFKNKLNNVKPLLLYTSDLQVYGSDQKKGSLYGTLNRFLRQQQFGKMDEKDYDKWQYRFASELMHQLNKIDTIKVDVLWRGVSYPPRHHVGQEVLFKQFNSSSTSLLQAQNFADLAIYKIYNPKSCRQIKQFSFFQIQDEVLFSPYVTIKIKNITKHTKKNGQIITLFEAEQVQKPPMPDSKSLFILWVDDKTKQGKQMWENLVEIQKTTVMIQLLSTEELQNWLSQNRQIINDPSVELVMITNMTRAEKGVKVEKAGVHSIQTFRQYKPESHIFVYIGWIEGTLAKLKQHQIEVNQKLRVSNSEVQIKKFLQQIGVK